jgi:RNA-directed DNA polymerase
VKSYYASIDHEIFMEQLRDKTPDKIVLKLIWQYLSHAVYQDGIYKQVATGICLGCPLSPLMAAVYLEPLDSHMEASGVFYTRFMDDWVALTKTRWQLRRGIKTTREILNALKVDIHPDKTFVGRVSREFTFL